MKNHSSHRKITQELLAEIHSALPCAPLAGIDYSELRGRLRYGFGSIRLAIQIMIAAGVVTETNSGIRNRKVFQRVGELPQVSAVSPTPVPVKTAQARLPSQCRPRDWLVPTGGNIRTVYNGALPAQIASVIAQLAKNSCPGR